MRKREIVLLVNHLVVTLNLIESNLLEVKALIDDNYEEHQDECEELLDAIGVEIEALFNILYDREEE